MKRRLNSARVHNIARLCLLRLMLKCCGSALVLQHHMDCMWIWTFAIPWKLLLWCYCRWGFRGHLNFCVYVFGHESNSLPGSYSGSTYCLGLVLPSSLLAFPGKNCFQLRVQRKAPTLCESGLQTVPTLYVCWSLTLTSVACFYCQDSPENHHSPSSWTLLWLFLWLPVVLWLEEM